MEETATRMKGGRPEVRKDMGVGAVE